jgi:hypothetical protein
MADVNPYAAVTLGPTWQKNEDGSFKLPELTLGWQILRWIEDNLLSDETDAYGKRLPFKPTKEQARFILWWYAIDETGRFIYREGVLQRLKGWGKDPLAAALAAVEFVGPCRFAGWTTVDRPDLDLEAGDPIAKPHPLAWIQVAATSEKQTKNTMLILRSIFTDKCKEEHRIDIGKLIIYAYNGARQIECLTSSPDSLEGNRPTFVIKNETHHWKANNNGILMMEAIERNATKSKGGAARTLSITNAFEPSEESVARMERDAYEEILAGAPNVGIMYDSLEASPAARIFPPKADKDAKDPTLEELTEHLTKVLESVRGDAVWLDIPSLIGFILNKKNKASTSRRFWFNQVTGAEDSWVDPSAVDLSVDPLAEAARKAAGADVLRSGWLPLPDSPIVMFGDGSKSNDSTALMGCELSSGYVFTIGVWQKPKGKRGDNWLAPRGAVDQRVKEAFKRFKIVAFWFDPSHALDDDDSSRYWDHMVDSWAIEFRGQLDERFWPVKSGPNVHAVMWDMTSPERTKTFTGAAETFQEEMENLNDIEEFAPLFTTDGHPAFKTHLKNAKAHPNQFGVSLGKVNRSSDKKIDMAVAGVGARMLRRIVLNAKPEQEPARKPGRAWRT